MNDRWRALACFVALACTSPSAPSYSAADEPPISSSDGRTSELVPRLIDALGSDAYVERRRAETRLLALGAKAFDHLQAAELSLDLEIATRARYILYQIHVEWARADDAPVVRKLMMRYGDLPATGRRVRILRLAGVAQNGGLGALCRIARYDPSPRLARSAALAVLENRDTPVSRPAKFRSAILAEIGEAQSIPVQWLRTFASQLQQPSDVDARWLSWIDAELALVRQEAEDTDVAVALRLLRYHLELSLQAANPPAVFATLQRRVDLLAERVDLLADLLTEPAESLGHAQVAAALDWTVVDYLIGQLLYSRLQESGGADQLSIAWATTWIIEHRQWESLDLMERHYHSAFQDDRLLLYLLAVARGQQGREQDAAALATRAFLIDVADAEMHNAFASIVEELGRHDWCEREWKQVIDSVPATDRASLEARKWYALLRLHDRGEDKAAAEILTESLDALDASPEAKSRIMEDAISGGNLKGLKAQREFYLACAFEAEGNFEAQRKKLDQAASHHPEDPDILIAKYYLKGADEAYRKVTRRRIEAVCRKKQFAIEKNPGDPNYLNYWAWLVSNTEGDFEQAIKYSLRSLQLQPGRASFLDTLGRCYFAAGDLENAIRYQREAVEKHPHMQVMRRQLALFEQELASRKQTPAKR